MKKLIITGFCTFLLVFGASLSSCSKKTGCPVNETVHAKTNKKGDFSTKKGNSNLFPKNMRKKRN